MSSSVTSSGFSMVISEYLCVHHSLLSRQNIYIRKGCICCSLFKARQTLQCLFKAWCIIPFIAAMWIVMFHLRLLLSSFTVVVAAYLLMCCRVDQPCACCCCLPRVCNMYGVHPARRFHRVYGEHIARKTGNADITFRQVSRMFWSFRGLCCEHIMVWRFFIKLL